MYNINNLVADQAGNILQVVALRKTKKDNINIDYLVLDRSKYPLPDGWKAAAIRLNSTYVLEGKNKYSALEAAGFIVYSYGYEKDLDLNYKLRLIVMDSWYYPQIEQAPELSSEDLQIVSLIRIKYIHELQKLWLLLSGGKELEINIKKLQLCLQHQ